MTKNLLNQLIFYFGLIFFFRSQKLAINKHACVDFLYPPYLCDVAFQRQQFVDVTTGYLGQGLGVACGIAYTGKYFDKAR